MIRWPLLSGLILVLSVFTITSCEKNKQACCVLASGAPVPKAGNDTILALPADSVLLDGSASYDPDGKITSFLWSQAAGFPVSIKNVSKSKTMVTGFQKGTYRFALTVTDNTGVTAISSVTIQVEDTIYPPHPVGFYPYKYSGFSWSFTPSGWAVAGPVSSVSFSVDPAANTETLFRITLMLPGGAMPLVYVDSSSMRNRYISSAVFYTLQDASVPAPGEGAIGSIYIVSGQTSGIDLTKKFDVVLFVKQP